MEIFNNLDLTSPSLFMYALKSKVSVTLRVVALTMVELLTSKMVLLGMGQRMHLWRRFPMNSCRPMRANTASAKMVKIITSTIFLTDWIKAPTMVFKPGWKVQGEIETKFFFFFFGVQYVFFRHRVGKKQYNAKVSSLS